MNKKDKAIELIDMFLEYTNDADKYEYAKKCALITVNEIIKSEKLDYLFTQNQINSMESTSDDRWIHETFIEYWNEVKLEIQKL